MKKYLIVLFTIAFAACSSLTSAEKAERDAKKAQAVEKALAERRYKVEISMMNPRRGGSVNVSPDFSLEVKGDTLVSYLPYFGRTYSVPYGGGKGLNFTAPISEYHTTEGRNGAKLIMMKAVNEEDVYSFRLEIFTNGNTTIDLTARERESISYDGHLEVEP